MALRRAARSVSATHASWLVVWPFGRRWFETKADALRYLAHHDAALDGPAVLVGLDTKEA
jgi:hypothetical protein